MVIFLYLQCTVNWDDIYTSEIWNHEKTPNGTVSTAIGAIIHRFGFLINKYHIGECFC